MSDVAMPRLSDSMEEGTIIRWLIGEGASVERGQEFVEIETDKASMTYEADASGVLHILAQEGDTLAVGAPIAQLLNDGEQPATEPREKAQPAVEQPSEPAAQAAPSVQGEPLPAEPDPAADPSAEQTGRVKASPLARRLAATHGLDLAAVSGSGPGGRIVRADVERASSGKQTALQHASTGTGSEPVRGQTELVELSRTQTLIARRMAEAKATIPEFTLQRVIDMEQAVTLRAQLKALAEFEERPVPSFNDLVVKACALALREHPRANGTYKDGRFELHRRVNVGVAVAVSDALLVPVIHDADERSVWEIATRTRELAERARQGTITPPELGGATFSISNLGMYGIDSFTAVINPPQAAILAVGALAPRPVVRDAKLTIANTMTVTLTCDHRILYGAQAAEFLDRICLRLERAVSLLT